MSQQRPVIDSADFASQGRELSGKMSPGAPGEMARLAESLFDATGRLRFSVTGECVQGAAGTELALVVAIDGTLRLVCQRCLGPIDWPVAIRSRLLLVEAGAPWPDENLEDDSSDAIEASPGLDVAGLLEDELLLAMPIAPMHADCRPVAAPDSSGRPSPFAELARLRRN